ncbi:hypothetical protein ACOME3_010818 [Neoechinorhynchus agilis]
MRKVAQTCSIKYLLPLSDYACTREGIWVHPLIELLEDDDNDVSTAATSCLLYLIPSIEQELSSDELCALVQKLNDFSAHFDDLSSSSYVVTLISKLMPLVQRSKAFDKTLLYQMLDSLWKSVDAPVRMECLHCIDKMLRLIMNYEHVQLEYVVNDVVMIDKVLRMLFGRIYFELNPVLTDKYINTFSTCIDRVSAKPRVLLKLTYDCMTSMIRALTLEELKGVEIANICGVRVDGYEQIGDAFKLRFDTMNKVNRDCTKVRTWFACAKCFAHMVARTLVAVGSIDDLKEGDNDPSEIQRALLDRIAHGYDSGSLIDSMRGQHRIIIYIIIAEIAEALRGMTFFGEEKSEIDVWYLSPFRSIEHVQSVFRPSLDRNIAGESQVFIEVADCIRNAEKIYQILRQKLLQNSKSAAGALPATLYAVSDMDEFRQSLLNMMDEKIRYMYESMIELINESRSIESTILTRTTALAATGLIRLNAYDPAKLNPIIAPLINSIKHDVNPFIRACTADSICR